MRYNLIIIGSGITGCSIAFILSKYQDFKILVIEKENDVALKTTKANSGIIHAGYDPLPNTTMARLNVLGNKLVDEYSFLNYHYQRIGSLVIGSTEEDYKKINELYDRGIKNGVPDLKILKTRNEVLKEEPNLAKDIDYALLAKTCGIVSPWEMCLAFAYNAKENGVDFTFSTLIESIDKEEDLFKVKTNKGVFESNFIINAAGLNSDDIYKMALKEKKDESFKITPVKGEYFLLDKKEGDLVNHVIFQTPSKNGKGVLVSRTVHHNLIVGPNAISEDVKGNKEDVSTLTSSLSFIKEASKKTIENINFGDNIRNFSGLRATIKDSDDFLIEESPLINGFINFAGIKSPGLTCSLAFGYEAIDILKKMNVNLKEKKDYRYYILPTYFNELSNEEKAKKIKENPLYGKVICRCETITEAEILNSLHAPIPATTIDGVKRRTNAGMGRCQGGFCGPKVFEIIKDELHLNYDEVYQDNTGSKIALAITKEDITYEK